MLNKIEERNNMEKKRFKKIYVEITNSCNLKCSFCPEGKREKEFISIGNFKHIIKEIKEYTNLIALHVKGEPLLHPKIKDILEVCKENKILVNITTNATLLEKNLNTIISSGAIRQLNLSLHSITKNENTDKYNFEKYINSVLSASKEILEKTNIIISFRLWNLENIAENSENYHILNALESAFSVENLKEIARKEKFVKLAENAFLNQDLEFVWPSLENEFVSDEGTCWGLRNQVAILVNGDVVPCCLDGEGCIKLGNILEDSFENIINSEYSRKFIKAFEEGKIMHNLCKKCEFRRKFDK